MPDLDSRHLATEFFTVGARLVDSEYGLAILIAGMQEALSTWQAHVIQGETPHLTEEDHHVDPI